MQFSYESNSKLMEYPDLLSSEAIKYLIKSSFSFYLLAKSNIQNIYGNTSAK